MADNHGTSLPGILCRLTWMFIGPMLLALMSFLVVSTGKGWMTGADLGFLGVLTAIMLARWLEFRGGNPLTAAGEPATPEHLRRFLVGALLISGLGGDE